MFISEDDEATFPGVETFKVSYNGLTTDREETTKISANGDSSVELTVSIKGGDVSFDILTTDHCCFVFMSLLKVT